MSGIQIGGWVPLTTQDFPGRLACVVFIQGCPWRCSYCHNPHLQPGKGTAPTMVWDDVLSFLKRRQGLLDGVVFSGGEPLADSALGEAVKGVKSLGFQVGLHTAGCFPNRLAPLLDDIDWIGLDIKTEPEYYDLLTQAKHSAEAAFKSLELILTHKHIELECRTTIAPEWMPEARLLALGKRLSTAGVRRFVLQPAHFGMPGDRRGMEKYPSEALCQQLSALFPDFFVR